jgi:hypothetical protein
VIAGDGAVVLVNPGKRATRFEGALARYDGAWISRLTGGKLVTSEAGSDQMVSSQPVPAGMNPGVMSRSGGAVALVEREPGDTDPYKPVARATTKIAIADTTSGTTRSFELNGNYEPEAFSTDDSELFLIEYLPAMDPTRYRVRRLLLSSGQVVPIGRSKQFAPKAMRGTGRVQVPSPDGNFLYTLYTRQPRNDLAHGGVGSEAVDTAARQQRNVYAFVHVLSLAEGWAHCIDLRQPFGTGDAEASGLAVTADGSKLYVVDTSKDVISAIDTKRLAAAEPIEVDLEHTVRPPATVMDDGTLVVGDGQGLSIYKARAGGFERTDRWELGTTLSALMWQDDALYGLTADDALRIDPHSGRTTGRYSL